MVLIVLILSIFHVCPIETIDYSKLNLHEFKFRECIHLLFRNGYEDSMATSKSVELFDFG